MPVPSRGDSHLHVHTQSANERNYHVFYQLWHCGDPELLADAGMSTVGDLTDFHYLGQSGCTTMRYESDDKG